MIKKCGWGLNYQVSPINEKVQGISNRLRPNNLQGLRSFLGAVNQLNRFIPDLGNICAPFQSILKKDVEWKWNENYEIVFKKVNEEVNKVAEVIHFKRNLPLRII